MARSITAVFAGLCLIVTLSFAADVAVPILIPWAFAGPEAGGAAGLLLLTLTYVAFATAAGGYLTAYLAARHPARHALVLGGLGLVLVAIGTAFTWTSAPAWYHLLSLAFAVPFACLGGYLQARAGRARR
jgi:hypothetical protein